MKAYSKKAKRIHSQSTIDGNLNQVIRADDIGNPRQIFMVLPDKMYYPYHSLPDVSLDGNVSHVLREPEESQERVVEEICISMVDSARTYCT